MLSGLVNFIGGKIARFRNQQKSFDYELAVGAIFKDEGNYLEEWLQFHHGVGVRHFYLYNDDSSDNYAEVLAPWIQKGIVTLIPWAGKSQGPAYKHCIRHYRYMARWIAFIDLDEFLFSPKNDSLVEVLKGYQDVSAVFVYWVLFGSSGHQSRPPGSVIENYQQCLDQAGANADIFDHGEADRHSGNYVTGWSRDGKSIVNPRLVRSYSLHRPNELWIGEVVDENRNPIKQRHKDCKLVYQTLRINHYWSKSMDELTRKILRGSTCDKQRPKGKLARYLTRESMLNGTTDKTILTLWERIKQRSR